MRDPKIDLAVELVKLENPDIETTELIQQVLNEFNINVTEEDINAIYASYLPDNFEAESLLIEHYERDLMHIH